MDWQFLSTIIKVAIFLPIILLLIYLSAKIGGGKLQGIQSGRFIRILERVSISRDNALMAVKIGEKGYLVSSSAGRVEILKEISDEELAGLEASKNVNINLDLHTCKDIYNKFKHKKED